MEGIGKLSFEVEGILSPLRRTRPSFYIVSIALLGIVGVGLYAYLYQLGEGLGSTGMNRPIFWGM